MNSSANNTRIEHLEDLEALDKDPQLVLIILYSLTSIVSFVSNCVVIFVLLFAKKTSPELRKFLVNLGVSDILMASMSIPFTYSHFMLGRWVFPGFVCPFAQFITICAPSVSVYTLTAIGFERYLAIKYPLRRSSFFIHHGNKVIGFIWLFGTIISLPQFLASKVISYEYANQIVFDCKDHWNDNNNEKIFLWVIFVMTFALPIVFLTFTYGSIGLILRRHITPGNADSERDKVFIDIKIKAVKMMCAVVIMFVLCWLPIQVFNLFVYNGWHLKIIQAFNISNNGFIWFYFVCHFMAMGHSMVNPFIYCFMSDNFILDLKHLICNLMRSRCLNTNRNHSMNNSNQRHTIISQSNGSTRV